MKERFIVNHSPEPGDQRTQRFERKGLAFAYAGRRAPGNSEDRITVERQVADPTGSVVDDKTGVSLRPTDVWTFHKSGDVDHARL